MMKNLYSCKLSESERVTRPQKPHQTNRSIHNLQSAKLIIVKRRMDSYQSN